MANEAAKTALKKMPKGSISLMIAGDLILAKCKNRDQVGLFRRYEALFETLANMPKDERILNYLFLNALMMTSYAKKAENQDIKKELFDLKNKIFLSIANHRELKKKAQFTYLVSKNFRVLKFCDKCTASNTENKINKHNWKYCKDCNVDRNFYNILAMNHKFKDGHATIFLSNDQLENIPYFKIKHKAKLGQVKEEARLGQYHYNAKNLDAIDLASIKSMHKMASNKLDSF